MGNIYVRYSTEEASDLALQKLQGRFYAGRMLQVELSTLTDFKEARCRQYEEAQCARGGYCNFVHWKYVPRKLKRKLRRDMYEAFPDYYYGYYEKERGERGGDRDRERGGDRDRRG